MKREEKKAISKQRILDAAFNPTANLLPAIEKCRQEFDSLNISDRIANERACKKWTFRQSDCGRL